MYENIRVPPPPPGGSLYFRWSRTICAFLRHAEEQFCEIILNLDQWLRRRCHLKGFLSGALAALVFCGDLSNFGRGHNGEPSSSWEVILTLDQLFRRIYRVKKKFTGRQRFITIAHLEPSAQVS